MRSILVGIALMATVVASGCTKKNPNLCCTDAADCEAQGLPDDAQCGDGLVCRGNQCIAEACAASSDCDAAAPYCLLDQGGRCAEACTADTQCPGAGQDVSDMFCVGGACVACRDGMNDCPTDSPVCDTGACRQCVENTECASGACASDGSCVPESEIAFVAPNGSAVSDCSRVSPCTLPAAVALITPRAVIEFASGLYTTNADVTLSGIRRLIGVGGDRPQITRSTEGHIFAIAVNSDVSFEHLEVFGAEPGTGAGIGLDCPLTNGIGPRTIRLDDDFFHNNASAGVHAVGCTVFAKRSTFATNGQGLDVESGDATIDRCEMTGNATVGLGLDGGLFAVTNTFVTRNSTGVALFVEQQGSHLDFMTIVDNVTGYNLQADAGISARFGNGIVARNGPPSCPVSGNCGLFPGSIISADVAGLNFKSADLAPFDYHITSGSAAIDAADSTIATDHDFDGDPRPIGKAMDVGADEAK